MAISDVLFIIIGTAAITALLISIAIGGRTGSREPQVIYIQATPDRHDGGAGCLPLLVAISLIAIVLFAGI